MNQNNEDSQVIENECLVLKNLIDRFKYSYNLLISDEEESYYNKPFLYLEDLLYFKENFELLLGTEEFNDFQLRYCRKLLTMIKKYINDDIYTYKLEIDDDGYYYVRVSIDFQNKYNYLLILYPFTRNICYPENEHRKQILEKISNCELDIDELRENEKELIMSKKNPLISSDNPMEMLKISLNKKKYVLKFNNSLKENDNNVNACYNQLAGYKSELEELDNFDSYLELNRENLLLDIKKSPFEFYLIEPFDQEENIQDDLKTENPTNDIVFFE